MPKEKQNIIYKKMGSAKHRRDGLLDVEHNINKFLLKHPELKKYEGDLRKETQHFKKVYKFQYLPHYYFYDNRRIKEREKKRLVLPSVKYSARWLLRQKKKTLHGKCKVINFEKIYTFLSQLKVSGKSAERIDDFAPCKDEWECLGT